MTVSVSFVAQGMTRQDYDQASRALNQEPHAGLLLHTVAVVEGGLQILDIWDSAEAFQAFAQNTLGPGLASMGFTEQPDITVHDLYNIWVPAPEDLASRGGPGSPADR